MLVHTSTALPRAQGARKFALRIEVRIPRSGRSVGNSSSPRLRVAASRASLGLALRASGLYSSLLAGGRSWLQPSESAATFASFAIFDGCPRGILSLLLRNHGVLGKPWRGLILFLGPWCLGLAQRLRTGLQIPADHDRTMTTTRSVMTDRREPEEGVLDLLKQAGPSLRANTEPDSSGL
jgi:hypothetical protein